MDFLFVNDVSKLFTEEPYIDTTFAGSRPASSTYSPVHFLPRQKSDLQKLQAEIDARGVNSWEVFRGLVI